MKSFEEISNIVFFKANKERLKEELTSTELKAYNALVDIAKSFRKEEITKEQATAEKLKLKEKYEACTRHVEIMADILDFILEGEWGANDTVEYATFIAISFMDIANKIDGYNLPMYNGLAIEVEKYLENKIKADLREE